MTFEAAIAAHAQEAAPHECCGLVVRNPETGEVDILRAENRALDPTRFFEIAPEFYLEALNRQPVLGYYHSHVDSGPEPSEADKHAANAAKLPLYIHSVPEAVLGCYVPDGYAHGLEGRPFVPMVFDCVSLVWDYLRQELGVELPLLPRTGKAYSEGVSFDWRPIMAAGNGAVVAAPPQPGDVLVMMINHSARPNHLGVYLGDGHFLHQRGDMASQRDVWAGGWRKATAFIVRFPRRIPAEQEEMGDSEALGAPPGPVVDPPNPEVMP